MGKISRVRTGCWTCKKRHRKCDEAKPRCNNCVSTNRHCEGYEQRLLFDIDLPKRFQKREKVSSGKRNISAAPESLLKDDSKNDLSHIAKPSLLHIYASTPKITPASFIRITPSSASVNHVMKSTGCSAPIELKVTPKSVPQSHFTNDARKSPLSSFFEGLLPSGDDRESFAKIPLDTTLDDFLFGSLNEALFADKNESNTNLDTEILELIGKAHVFDKGDFPAYGSSLVMSHQEENRMLGHFFQNLLPLLDAHPQSPWPALALRYCDYDVARSCFISLACIHIYESQKGGNEYYDNGIAHIHSTMKLLIDSISESSPEESSGYFGTTEKAHVQSFVILVLINVHILFAVLEKGKSSLTRYLFKVFGSICQDGEFYRSCMQDESKGSLVVVLSWYDTVSAMISPDCRLPFCNPEWYGSAHNVISTSQMMGCPGEIFRALSEVCFLRHEIYNGSLLNDENLEEAMDSVKGQLFRYREYVQYKDGTDYMLRLKVAQCWSLAVYVSLLRLFKTDERKARIQASVHEFIEIYSSIPSTAPIVMQMVWPVYAIGCECINDFERDNLSTFMDTLYETAKMGTLASLRWIVKEVWQRGSTQEEVLVKWLEEGVDYLPL